jgi:hypothetical protein
MKKEEPVMRRIADTNQHLSPPRKAALVLTILALLAGISAGVYGLWFAPTPGTSPAPTSSGTTPTSPDPTSTGTPVLSRNPEWFARQAASVLFDWDTTATQRTGVIEQIVALGDPTGVETAGLALDITNYLPDQATWLKLRDHHTSQRLDIATVAIPESWDDVTAAATPGQLLPGTVAYTITGSRHRDGIYQDQPLVFDQPVAFTLFVACAPAFPECHLLRLSMPDQPMK